nr:uncharacterized protein LOC119624493 [Chlorocebus sabaeus]
MKSLCPLLQGLGKELCPVSAAVPGSQACLDAVSLCVVTALPGRACCLSTCHSPALPQDTGTKSDSEKGEATETSLGCRLEDERPMAQQPSVTPADTQTPEQNPTGPNTQMRIWKHREATLQASREKTQSQMRFPSSNPASVPIQQQPEHTCCPRW